jgi:hypothetical protein
VEALTKKFEALTVDGANNPGLIYFGGVACILVQCALVTYACSYIKNYIKKLIKKQK